MKSTTKKVTLNSDRVKQAMKSLKGTGKNGKFTNMDLAILWNIENEKSISRFFGSAPISIERVKMFTDLCNKDNYYSDTAIRWEYFAGIDDYKTIEDMEKELKYKAISEYKDIIKYLKSLGLEITPTYYFITSINQLIEITENTDNLYDDIISYFTDDSKEHIKERISHKFPISEYKDECREYIELSDNPSGSGLLSIDDLIKVENRDPAEYDYYDEYIIYACDIFNDDNMVGSVAPMYKLTYNNKDIGLYDVLGMQGFFNHIDCICKASIESLLLNHTISFGTLTI